MSGNFRFTLRQGQVLHVIEDADKSTAELNVKYHKMSSSGTVTTRLGNVDGIVNCLLQLSSAFSEQELRTTLDNMAYYKRTFVQENSEK